MPGQHNFEHLPLLLRYQGRARLRGFGIPSPQTRANRNARQAHSDALRTAAQSLSTNWQERKAQRRRQDLPVIPRNSDSSCRSIRASNWTCFARSSHLRSSLSRRKDMSSLPLKTLRSLHFWRWSTAFAVQVRGSATIAQVHRLFDDPDQADRLRRIFRIVYWRSGPAINDDHSFTSLTSVLPAQAPRRFRHPPTRGKRDTDADWARKERDWSQARTDAYNAWDNIKSRDARRRSKICPVLPSRNSASHRRRAFRCCCSSRQLYDPLKIVGKGLKDFVLNYPYIFEVVEPEDIALPQRRDGTRPQPPARLRRRLPPDADAPAVCVIDSGIQEAHILIQPAIDHVTSHCFLPGKNSNDVGDFVRPAAMAPAWPAQSFTAKSSQRMARHSFPSGFKMPACLTRTTVCQWRCSPRSRACRSGTIPQRPARTRAFSITQSMRTSYCRTRYMSAWAAEIDLLCAAYDVLFVQSAGNLPISGTNPQPGVKDHLLPGAIIPPISMRRPPGLPIPAKVFRLSRSVRLLMARWRMATGRTFAPERGHPSAFSRSGFGIWNVIKPEVVEYGGDDVRTTNAPADVQEGGRIAAACPELVRSTMFPPGPPFDRDDDRNFLRCSESRSHRGQLQRVLPDEPALLYRALIVQSARWPTWAEALLAELRHPDSREIRQRRQAVARSSLPDYPLHRIRHPGRGHGHGQHRPSHDFHHKRRKLDSRPRVPHLPGSYPGRVARPGRRI